MWAYVLWAFVRVGFCPDTGVGSNVVYSGAKVTKITSSYPPHSHLMPSLGDAFRISGWPDICNNYRVFGHSVGEEIMSLAFSFNTILECDGRTYGHLCYTTLVKMNIDPHLIFFSARFTYSDELESVPLLLTCGSVVCKFLADNSVLSLLLDLPSVRKMTTTGTLSSWRPCCWISGLVVFSPAAEFVSGINSRDQSVSQSVK